MKIQTAICLSFLINITNGFGWGSSVGNDQSDVIEIMLQDVDDPNQFVDQMKDRVILFPEENRKLKYFKNDEIYPRLKDTENTQDTMATHPRQRRSNKRVSVYSISFFLL